MAGIYIPNMQMPNKCEFIYICADGKAFKEVVGLTERQQIALAIAVPDHGRLIDKDVMCNECRRIAEEYDGIYPDCTYCPAHLAPAIIPAEEGET